MNRTRYEQIDQVLAAALALEPAARAAFLREACADDAALCAEVEALLAEEAAAPILDQSAVAFLAEAGAAYAGQRVGHFTLEARIGAGGMGEVWRAQDAQLDRTVALKFLPPDFAADPERARRFAQEARTVSALNHPNIVTVHEIGQAAADGDAAWPFIVTELIAGRTLREHLSAQAVGALLDWRESVLIAAQIVAALHAAHTAGIIHRDIKPENVMVQADGLVKVLDFGIAKWVSTASLDGVVRAGGGETQTGLQPGTLRYMSPEQLRGELLDGRSDIFALGLVLYEMLAGQHPYNGLSGEQLRAALGGAEEIPSIGGVRAALPAALVRLVTRALRKDREARYTAASELLAELNELKALIEVGRGEPEQRQLRARNAEQLLTRYVVFHEADPRTRIPFGGLWSIWRDAALPRGPLEQRLIRRSWLGGAWRVCRLVLPVALLTLMLAAWASVSESWDERILRDGHTATARCAAFAPDGRRLVSGDEDGWVIVWDFARRERLAAFKAHAAWVNSIAFSPDGKWFITGGDDRNVIVWDAARLEQVAMLREHQRPVVSIAFSPDGRLMATASAMTARGQRGQTILWEVNTWRKTGELPLAFSDGRLSFSPDGRLLIASRKLQTWDLETKREAPDYLNPVWGGEETAIAAQRGRLVSISAWGAVTFVDLAKRKFLGRRSADHYKGGAIAISPDGRLVASGSGDIFLWDFETQTKLARLELRATVTSLAFSPDGRWLVSTHEDGAVLQWNVTDRERVANFNEHSGSVLALAWAPDGKRLASASEDRSVLIWDTVTGRKAATFTGHRARVTAVAYSYDGKWLASTGHDGEVILWDMERRQPRLAVNPFGQEQASYGLALSPDGRWVATTFGVYESAGGRQVRDFKTSPFLPQVAFTALAFSPDGRWLACVAQNYIDILWFDNDEWRLVHRLESLPLQFTSVSFSPDGKRLVTGEDEHGVRLWQVESLREEALLGRHAARVKSVCFSPDGSQVVSGGDDKMIALWDVAERRLITTIGLHTSPVYAVAFSPDGRQLISGEHDHSVRLYTQQRSLWGWRLD